MTLYHLSAISFEQQEYVDALKYNLESIKIFSSVEAPLDKLYSLILLGDLYKELGYPQKSSLLARGTRDCTTTKSPKHPTRTE